MKEKTCKCAYPIEAGKLCGKKATQEALVTTGWNPLPSKEQSAGATMWIRELCDEHYEIVKSRQIPGGDGIS
jgi:hypothetical protein